MNEFAEYLKKLRIDKQLSQAKVYQLTGITNSRLCKAENGMVGILTPADIKQLANLYGVSVISMYIMAGFLNESDLEEYSSGFRNISLLDVAEKKHIQDQIDFFVSRKEGM